MPKPDKASRSIKSYSSFLFLVFFTSAAYCQEPEFVVHPNGLIYSEQTMHKLTRIVDSLNLKFRNCNFNQQFYAISQTIGHLITVKKEYRKRARKDMENGMPPKAFLNKYPGTKIEKDILVLKRKYQNYNDETIVAFEHFDLVSDYGFSIQSQDLSLFEKNLEKKWLIGPVNDPDNAEEGLSAFYFPENFASNSIPKKYAQMIGYADCLVDTTTTKMKDNAVEGWVGLPENWTTLPIEKKAKLLDQMRNTRVMGFCSEDSRPRDHAVNIALLSADTYNWEIFLKAHLDIMNDRFDRMSDGSYAWAARNTYIKELEELNINVSDLILGISFRVKNPASNHYYGSIARIGRALSETKNRTAIENAMLEIIRDSTLDYYNRLIFYFLFKNYNHYLTDALIKKSNKVKLEKAATALPLYFSSRLKNKD